ncbi:TetR/AcrR family transcriptional regulator [Dactylosporangium aurantiacum]|uniref:TetR/AcrR family transcriptional regulator n=1 Tax=Dactylosporangium aurantiacum TaxID=35754 RepID=A0A9Q9IK67_9ACTN|nr:TetR/AcrR family transcriptional regulator [Dactylosporangium aurantiacum]MDG6105545.1 TetR/AcrR family transcriptional regulator [Dactylosporangium aurantiacum]UWZ57111.1 TetR/AcrR family transcriptional regulator [Dactylosporangium aurantiacum]
MRRSGADTREHLLQVAHDLFYWRGIRATGVDTVAAEAGVAPTTLYRLFGSKDGLVDAYVDHVDQGYRKWFTAATEPGAQPPRQQILDLFDKIFESLQPDTCRGCAFLMTIGEFPDKELPAHRRAVAMKAWIRERLHALVRHLAEVEPVDDPDALADRLALLIEGMNASVQALGVDGPVRQARATAELLLDAATARGAAHRPAGDSRPGT